MSKSVLKEYVQLIVEETQRKKPFKKKKKIKEVDVTDGSKVKQGSRKHIGDLKRRIKDLTTWRDKQKKGSDKRADYARIISRIKGELNKVLKSKELAKK